SMRPSLRKPRRGACSRRDVQVGPKDRAPLFFPIPYSLIFLGPFANVLLGTRKHQRLILRMFVDVAGYEGTADQDLFASGFELIERALHEGGADALPAERW